MKKLICLWMLLLGLTGTAWAIDAENQKILKDAVVGAVTGAVAAEATKDTPEVTSNVVAGTTPSDTEHHKHKNFTHKHHHHDKGGDDDDQGHHKDKKRPHGWDMGKKTGWHGKDTPPGQSKKD